MARKKAVEQKEYKEAYIQNQPITETIEKNYMPYVMTVIVSRAIPEIDGFKPSHRKLLYTMYKMGLLTGARTKSANVVGQTMKLNPHGDSAIYETMVRLTKGNAALLHPFVDSKGSFGKQYSRDMAYAASRYTEVKLSPICSEIFSGIDKDAVDMVPNYDNTMKEPSLLPTTFPNVLVSPNTGIAVGMASSICSFNLSEICDGTIALLKNNSLSTDKLMEIIKAPDFSGGADLIYDREKMKEIFETGRGSVRLRAKYRFDAKQRCIEITEIPYSTSIELIMKRLMDMYKEGKLKEVNDIRDEIDLNGFKLTIDVKTGTDPDKLMAKLFRQTPLEDDFSCNFNVLIDGAPKQLGVGDILREWIRFRMGCLVRELSFELRKKKDKMHLLRALGKILLDIDKAIAIVRDTQKEADVVPRLMEGFKIDEIQAEFIAEIKLRHLNREYIIARIHEIEELQKEIADLEATISDELKIKALIIDQLKEIKKKYHQDRRTSVVYSDDIEEDVVEEEVENYNIRVVLTKDGYFKKTTYQSLRGADEQRLKEGDEILNEFDTENKADLFFISDGAKAYRTKADSFAPVKASALGDYIPAKLGFDEGEKPILMRPVMGEFESGAHIIYIFANGKGVRVPIEAYETKGNRRRLTNAYSSASPVVAAFYEEKDKPVSVLIMADDSRGIHISSSLIPEKVTRSAGGVTLMSLKKGRKVVSAVFGKEADEFPSASKYRKTKIPSPGVLPRGDSEQLTMI